MTRRHGADSATRTVRAASPRATTIVARSLWALSLAFLAIGLLTPRSGGPIGVVGSVGGILAALLVVLPAVTVGTILATRLPRNAVGWLLLIGGLTIAIILGTSALADYGLNVRPGSVPGAVWLEWLNQWSWLPVIACGVVYLPLVFPTGRLLSPRWRIVTGAGTVGFVVATAESSFAPFTPGSVPSAPQNPLAVTVGGPVGDFTALLGTGSHVVVIGTVFLSLASLVIRRRRASGVERLQLKWFAAVIAIAAPAIVIALLTSNTSSGIIGDVSNVSWAIAFIGFALLPVAIGIAILRYRLYDIDRLISRGLSYGVLTAILASLFVGVILGLQAVLAPFTGSNTLAVAGSTLLVAALFQPLRRRVQRLVDRRFNRARYDAERILADFAGRLRDEVDLAALEAEITATVSRTVEPVSVALWVRE